MKLYFGKSTLTTLLLAGFVAYAALAFWRRAEIQHWGRRTLLVLAWGLVLCAQAAVRDGYHLSVQHAIDGSCAPGLFAAAAGGPARRRPRRRRARAPWSVTTGRNGRVETVARMSTACG